MSARKQYLLTSLQCRSRGVLCEAYDCKPMYHGKVAGQFVYIFMLNVKIQNQKTNVQSTNYMSGSCGIPCENSTGYVSLIDNFDKYLSNHHLVVQAEEGTDREVESKTTEEQVNVTFDDNIISNTVMIPKTNSLYKPSGSVNADIGKFLSRPVLIDSRTWRVGDPIDTSFRPWQDFFSHTSIKNKINNYSFIRCDLHLKVMINASPFYYGALMYSYSPLVGLYNSAIASGDKLVPYSQRPNIKVYPQNSEGAEMVLPFLYPYEWLNITSSNDLYAMGAVTVDSFGNLLNANSVVGSDVEVQVYAWAENVELAGLTVKLAVQGDEYGKGVVSKPATAIARATGLLSNLPAIGPYMTATSIAAEGVANIAAMFGYSKVPVISDVQAFKNLPFHGLATSDISDCTERLCVDSKNELTINNTCLGTSDAEPLVISNFVGHPSYLTTFTWAATATAGDLLWNSYVSPYMCSKTAGTGQTIVNGTPMFICANMFDFWRGDIIFDLKIICSKFHRGRLRISWDPVGDIANTNASSTEVYTTIVDITETTNVSIRVPYTQRAAYLKTPSLISQDMYQVASLAVDSSDTINGIFTVRVLNMQSSPVLTSDINVLVSVRGAENLEFAAPKEIDETIQFYTVQGSIEDVEEVDFGGRSTTDDHINLIYMGEKVTNLRSLLMRCNYSRSLVEVAPTSQSEYHIMEMARRPLFKGYDPNGIDLANPITGAGNKAYNFVNTTPYHLISQCFLGERGSFTWKVNYDGYLPACISVTRPKSLLLASKYNFSSTNLTSLSINKQKALFMADEVSTSGALVINQRTQTGISFNVPQYSNQSFYDTSPAYRTLGLSNVTSNDSLKVTFVAKESTHSEVDYEHWHTYFQVGPDYSPVFFLNVPTMYYYDSLPTGV